MYDKNNIFAKIIRGEISCEERKIYENEFALSFYDIKPTAEIHALVIPKGPYKNILDFSLNASSRERDDFWTAFNKTAEILGLENNFNVWANAGTGAPFIKQTVPHFHLHLVAGKPLIDVSTLMAG